MDSSSVIARTAIGSILDGAAPNGVDPAQMGRYQTLYVEMRKAYDEGGTPAARRVFEVYARQDRELAGLIAGNPRKVWTAAELLAAIFPDPRWCVSGLISAGLNFLGGRPKTGKSWLALQIAVAVATGGVVLGRRVEQGRVLYLALEDSPRRLQDRLRKQHAHLADKLQADFIFEWKPLAEEGTADLIQAIDREGYTLVVIDTISRALGRMDQLDAVDMNLTLGALQRIAIDRDVTVLLLDHHRKASASNADVVDDILGATAKTGVADVLLGLYRERGKADASLRVTGRDVDDQEIAVKFDAETGCWQPLGDASGVRAETVQSDILIAIKEMGGKATVQKVAEWLRRDKGNVYREMQELVAKGRLKRLDKKGKQVFYELIEGED